LAVQAPVLDEWFGFGHVAELSTSFNDQVIITITFIFTYGMELKLNQYTAGH
jgi:hypothetical protein